jgi:hypothetical protein
MSKRKFKVAEIEAEAARLWDIACNATRDHPRRKPVKYSWEPDDLMVISPRDALVFRALARAFLALKAERDGLLRVKAHRDVLLRITRGIAPSGKRDRK